MSEREDSLISAYLRRRRSVAATEKPAFRRRYNSRGQLDRATVIDFQ
jgi:hypothetical protein